jgi:hypothetical protein
MAQSEDCIRAKLHGERLFSEASKLIFATEDEADERTFDVRMRNSESTEEQLLRDTSTSLSLKEQQRTREDAFRDAMFWFQFQQLKENMPNELLQMIFGFTLDSEVPDYLRIDEALADGHSGGQVCWLNRVPDLIYSDQ